LVAVAVHHTDLAQQPINNPPALRHEAKLRNTKMLKSRQLIAEQQFAATQKKKKPVQKEKDNAGKERLEQTARLRALRLGKEAADQEVTDPKIPSAADQGGSEDKAQGTTDSDGEVDLLEIPSHLRRQTNEVG